MKTGLNSLLYVKYEKYKLHFYSSSLSLTLWSNTNERDYDVMFLNNNLKKGETFIDVGASIGHPSLHAADISGQSGKLISMEAHPRTFEFLKKIYY